MSLDIRIKTKRNVVCPHCNKIVGAEDVGCVDSCGRGWYPFLEEIGYYVPHDKRTEENDWYGEDMVLTEEQRTALYEFIKERPGLFNGYEIVFLISSAIMDGNMVVVNADW